MFYVYINKQIRFGNINAEVLFITHSNRFDLVAFSKIFTISCWLAVVAEQIISDENILGETDRNRVGKLR